MISLTFSKLIFLSKMKKVVILAILGYFRALKTKNFESNDQKI